MPDRRRSDRRLVWALLVLVAALLAAASGLTSSASALDINTEVKMPEGEVGQAYEFEFDGEEGCQPYNFALYRGQLPPGLELANNGELSGTATAAGTFTFWVELTDGVPGGACHSPTPSQGEYSIIIAPNVAITADLHGTKVGNPFSAVISATGGGSLRWSVIEGALPPGLSLNGANGTLSGTPSSPGTFPFTVKVADDKRRATRQYSFVVAAPLAISAKTARGEAGIALTAKPSVAGGIGPIAWTSGNLPAGLSLDPATGTISGRPKASGTFRVPITATDSDGQAPETKITFGIANRLALTTAPLRTATLGTGYQAALKRAGGVGPVSWRVTGGKLPRGLALNRTNGVLSGTPRASGNYRFTVRVADAAGATSTRTFNLRVASA